MLPPTARPSIVRPFWLSSVPRAIGWITALRSEVVVRGLGETGGHERPLVRHHYQGKSLSSRGKAFTVDQRCVMVWRKTLANGVS